MAERKLSRKACEKRIWKLCEEIQRVYKSYNPDGDYLSVSINNKILSANNAYWEGADAKKPLDFYVIDGEIGRVY